MQNHHDEDISPDARAYIASLTVSAERDAAREYARMDDQSFKARIGPGMDALDAKVDRLEGKIDRVIDEVSGSRMIPISRKMLAGFALLGGGMADAAIQMAAQIMHNISGSIRP